MGGGMVEGGRHSPRRLANVHNERKKQDEKQG
jgi:hypothetical protein